MVRAVASTGEEAAGCDIPAAGSIGSASATNTVAFRSRGIKTKWGGERVAFHIFTPSVVGALRQGEIITGFTEFHVDVEKLRADADTLELIPIEHPFVIVLSQDCDLVQDFARRARDENEDLLESILFCAATPADADFRHGLRVNNAEWRKLKENRELRFHFIRCVEADDDAAAEGLPELVIDFKRYFALPTPEAYYWLESSVRRCRLESPYVEHLSNRFGAYVSRVGLPVDHHVPLPAEQLVPLPAERPVPLPAEQPAPLPAEQPAPLPAQPPKQT